MTAAIFETVEALRQSDPYRSYLRVRDNVLAALAEQQGATATPSRYWQEELAGFDYMLDASPLIVAKLREHCYHITGIKSYDYRGHHAHAAAPFARKLEMLQALDGGRHFVPENPALGGYGHVVDGKLVNIDTLKFYESAIAMDKAGLFDKARTAGGDRQVWLEIGAGWGGFGYTMKSLFPKVTYVIVDLPQTMLFSATYLMSVFPEARCAMYPESPLEECTSNAAGYDFVFLPHYVFQKVDMPIDLAVNMISFQEMTTEQVQGYVGHLAGIGCPRLYSHNRDRSAHNPELTAVSEIIRDSFAAPREIEVLGFAYTALMPPGEKGKAAGKGNKTGLFKSAAKMAKAAARTAAKEGRRPTDYRHLVAER